MAGPVWPANNYSGATPRTWNISGGHRLLRTASALSVSPHPLVGTMGAKAAKPIGESIVPQTQSPRYLSHVLSRHSGKQVLIPGTP